MTIKYVKGKKVYYCDHCREEVYSLYVVWDSNGKMTELCRACYFEVQI